jgi:hypothetical protein
VRGFTFEVKRLFEKQDRKFSHVFQVLEQSGNLKMGRGYGSLDSHEILVKLIL